METSLDRLLKELLAFYKERDWEQFHSPKNIVMDLYHSWEGLENFDRLRLRQIDLPPHPARLGQGLVGHSASFRFGLVSQGQNSQNLPVSGMTSEVGELADHFRWLLTGAVKR